MLTPQEVAHIAHLARLELTPEEQELYSKQLSGILEFVSTLKAVDTTGVIPTAQTTYTSNVFGVDALRVCPEDIRKRIVEGFPMREGDLCKVKAVFE